MSLELPSPIAHFLINHLSSSVGLALVLVALLALGSMALLWVDGFAGFKKKAGVVGLVEKR